MFKNISLNEINYSELNKELKNVNFENYDYNYLKTDFILDTKFLFPISIKSNQTSTNLFSHLYHKKYKHFFTKDYYEFINKNFNNLETFSNSFVIGSHENYYHFIIDILPRIFGYNKITKKYINNIVFSETKLGQNQIIKFVLETKNIDEEIISIKEGTYKFTNSIFTIKQNLQNIIYNYRSIFSGYLKNTKDKYIYISRSDAKQRKIINEDELINKLKNLNFEIVRLSELHFLDQIKLFNSAKCIVALHGAGLTNLIFSNEGTSVIEIFPDFTNPTADWYCRPNENINMFNMIRTHFVKISKINKLDHIIYFAKKINQNKINKKNFEMNNDEKKITSITTVDVEVNFEKLYELIKFKIKN